MEGEYEGWTREWPKENGYYWIDRDDHAFEIAELNQAASDYPWFTITGSAFEWNKGWQDPLWWPHRLEHPPA